MLDNPSCIGEHLKRNRVALRLLQKDVAEIIDVSEDCITNWENNRSEPQIRHYPKIIEFLGYNPFPIEESTLGGKIKKYRIENGLSHKNLGMLVGVDSSTICSWENNLTMPSSVHLRKLKGLISL